MIINNQFDTSLSFVTAIHEICKDKISDYMFSIACEEFNIDEDEAMELMTNSYKYEFIRYSGGWIIKKR